MYDIYESQTKYLANISAPPSCFRATEIFIQAYIISRGLRKLDASE